MRRLLTASWALVSLWGVVGCGDAEVGTQALDLSFSFAQGDDRVRCADLNAESELITAVEVRLVGPDQRLVPGFPREVDCNAGRVQAFDLAAGAYEVEIEAKGRLGGASDAVLYSTNADLSLPEDQALELVLTPQAARLVLTWSFGEDGLDLCGDFVKQSEGVKVTIATQASQDNFTALYDCNETPARIPGFFDLQEYTVRVEAFGPLADARLDAPIYRHTTRRGLSRGENVYTAILTPTGGEVQVDWQFGVGMDMTTMCDAESVQVSEIEIRLREQLGGRDLQETVVCTEVMRPYVFRNWRPAPAVDLELTMTAEGVHRFLATQAFTMPDGNWSPERITLVAVGTATVSFEVDPQACPEDEVVEYQVSLTPMGVVEPIATATVAPSGRAARFVDLPYGPYGVAVFQRSETQNLCTASGLRVVDGRSNDWEGFTLPDL